MALTKVTKHIIFGSTLIGHYGHDLSNRDSYSSSSWSTWGEGFTYTPQYADSSIEVCVTGSVFDNNNGGTSRSNVHGRIQVNGSTQYLQEGLLGPGYATQQGTHHFYNPRFSQHNVRQEFHASNFATGIYMNVVYTPGTTNAQTVEIQVNSANGHNCHYRDGFVTVTELSGPGRNLT